MDRGGFLVTPFVDLTTAAVTVRLHTQEGHDPVLVLDLGQGMTMHVSDPQLLARLVEVTSYGRDLLVQALAGQAELPVETAA